MFYTKYFFQCISKLVLLVLIIIAAGSSYAWASNGIKSKFLTAYPTAVGSRVDTLPSAPNHCGVCHYVFSSGAAPKNLNPYGQDIKANGTSPDDILAIGSLDSDGDGFSNNDEITGTGFTNIPTFPGLEPSNVSQVSGVTLSEINGFLVPVADVCVNDDDCDDDLFCNGIESCSAEASETGVCVDGTDPCTGDTPACIEETDTCVECVIDDDCAVGEVCEDNLCLEAVCPEGTPEQVLEYDEDGDCLLNKEELKKYNDTLKADQKAEKTQLKNDQKAEKDQYKLIKSEYSE